MKQYSVYFNSDVEAAFDSISHVALARYLHGKSYEGRNLETARLIQIATNVSLICEFAGKAFHIEQSRGIQQGGTHSSVLFSAILGSIMDSLQDEWMATGETNLHGVFLWSYVDDLLLCFRDRPQALRLSARLQEELFKVGLRVNLEKSRFISHSSMLSVPRDQFPENSAPYLCLDFLRIVQNLALVKLMMLCIPNDVPFSDAMGLQMLRKRVC